MNNYLKIFTLILTIGSLLLCSKTKQDDLNIHRSHFISYLTEHMDNCDIVINSANVLRITEKCKGWDKWRIKLDSVECIPHQAGLLFIAKNYSSINSAITKTWTPPLPDSLRGMGNSVTDPESTYTPACKNKLVVDSIVYFLKLLKPSKNQ